MLRESYTIKLDKTVYCKHVTPYKNINIKAGASYDVAF
uniref:Uncharacterized protein n=1 Tax=Anguilla anguilla TaxID=7936 RepID=A0A0E9W747_ANGAN